MKYCLKQDFFLNTVLHFDFHFSICLELELLLNGNYAVGK